MLLEVIVVQGHKLLIQNLYTIFKRSFFFLVNGVWGKIYFAFTLLCDFIYIFIYFFAVFVSCSNMSKHLYLAWFAVCVHMLLKNSTKVTPSSKCKLSLSSFIRNCNITYFQTVKRIIHQNLQQKTFIPTAQKGKRLNYWLTKICLLRIE